MVLSLMGCFCLPGSAQLDLSPWTAKFIVTHPNGIDSDTVWFGCDTSGGPGYQSGLDIIDTNFNGRIRILAYDEQVEADSGFGTCVNLKKDIRDFWEWGFKTFTFYIQSDSNGWAGVMATIDYDSLDFDFQNDRFQVIRARINTEYGYIDIIDNTTKKIYENRNGHYFNSGPSVLWGDALVLECPQHPNIIKIELQITFNDVFSGVFDEMPFNELSLSPNPSNSLIRYKIPLGFYGGQATIYDTKGLSVWNKAIHESVGHIDIDFLEEGSYFLVITNNQFTTSYRGTFIKL